MEALQQYSNIPLNERMDRLIDLRIYKKEKEVGACGKGRN